MSAEYNNSPGSADQLAPAAPCYDPAPLYAAPYSPMSVAGAQETAQDVGTLPSGLSNERQPDNETASLYGVPATQMRPGEASPVYSAENIWGAIAEQRTAAANTQHVTVQDPFGASTGQQALHLRYPFITAHLPGSQNSEYPAPVDQHPSASPSAGGQTLSVSGPQSQKRGLESGDSPTPGSNQREHKRVQLTETPEYNPTAEDRQERTPEEQELYRIMREWPRSVKHYAEYHFTFPKTLDSLDVLGHIIEQLERSGCRRNAHPVSRNLSISASKIGDWMWNCEHWRQARALGGKMPHIMQTAKLQALRYPDLDSAGVSWKVRNKLKDVDLEWHLDSGLPTPFWQGALLNDSNWRGENMERKGKEMNIEIPSPVQLGILQLTEFVMRIRQEQKAASQANALRQFQNLQQPHALQQQQQQPRLIQQPPLPFQQPPLLFQQQRPYVPPSFPQQQPPAAQDFEALGQKDERIPHRATQQHVESDSGMGSDDSDDEAYLEVVETAKKASKLETMLIDQSEDMQRKLADAWERSTLSMNKKVRKVKKLVAKLTTSVDTLTTKVSELQSLKSTRDSEELNHSVELLWEAVDGVVHRMNEAGVADQQLEMIRRLQESVATAEARWQSSQAELAAFKESVATLIKESVAIAVKESAAAAEGRVQAKPASPRNEFLRNGEAAGRR